jgi:hypothetical protein
MKKGYKQGVKALFLTFLVAFGGGCGLFEKDSIDNLPSNPQPSIGTAPDDSRLGILVSFRDVQVYPGKSINRLKVVTEQEFDSVIAAENFPRYRFLGRVYPPNFPGIRGFTIPLHEFYAPFGSPFSAGFGFQYLLGMQCSPGFTCPPDASVKIADPIAFVSPLQSLSEGIVPLFQYATPGGFTSGGTGNVSFTVYIEEIIGLQQSGIPVKLLPNNAPVGFIYHGTEKDRQAQRTLF